MSSTNGLAEEFNRFKSESTLHRDAADAILIAEAAMATLHAMQEIEKIYTLALPDADNPLSLINESFDLNNLGLAEVVRGLMPIYKQDFEARQREKILNQYYRDNVKQADRYNTAFDTIGINNNSPKVIQAQSLWCLATEYEHNEKEGIKQHIIRMVAVPPDFTPYEKLYVDGFRALAADLIQNASKTLHNHGQADLAMHLNEQVSCVSFDAEKAQCKTPLDFAKARVQAERNAADAVNNMLDPDGISPYQTANEEWNERLLLCGQRVVRPEPSEENAPFCNAPKLQ